MSAFTTEVSLDYSSKLTISDLVCRIHERENLRDIESLLCSLPKYLQEFPTKIHDSVVELKMYEKFHVLSFSNLPAYGDKELTPPNLRSTRCYPISKDEIQLLLFGALVGDIFTWDSIQDGRIINHVFPIKENSVQPISSNFASDFGLHTEDAFHECAGDYLVLYGYKNPTLVPTTVVYLGAIEIDDELKLELFKEQFIIRNNIAHSVSANTTPKTSILFGSFNLPYIRINLNESKTQGTTAKSQEALDRLKALLTVNKSELLIKEDQISIIDNYRTVHGREKYQPRFDGFDRWLKRLYITRDIRKSRKFRATPQSRIIKVK